jgi:hypothetical protein
MFNAQNYSVAEEGYDAVPRGEKFSQRPYIL